MDEPKSRKKRNVAALQRESIKRVKALGESGKPLSLAEPSYEAVRFGVTESEAVDYTDTGEGKRKAAGREEYLLLQEEIKLLEAQNQLIYGLPHLHGWKFYSWAREFFESRNHLNFLCAANQISKSSTQIRKAIHWATCKELWPQLWQREPSQFWYLYPSQAVVNIEFKLKWEKEFLPRGEYKNDPVYGWKVIKERGDIKGIEFNSGVFLFFKTYTNDVQHLQTGTCDAIFCDEELPVDLYDELVMRLNATDGYFHMVFTATMGQELWKRTMEPDEFEEEAFPTAAKWTVSLYEAMYYEDGTPSHWSEEKIAGVRAKCKNHQEVLKRVYGRFVILKGLKYPTFDSTKHVKPGHPIPPSWLISSGVDIGSGGNNHPAAIVYLAIRPDFRAGRVFLGWRGDDEVTVDSDIVLKYRALKKEAKLSKYVFLGQNYDHASKDFETVATRMGEPFQKADKARDKGESILNTLFKNNMLLIYEDAELAKLAKELSTLRENTPKNKAKDDFIDALRYAVSQVPWDFSGLVGAPPDLDDTPEEPLNEHQREINERRKAFSEQDESERQRIEDELEEWNDAYG